jgi:hypothetical protein
MEENNTWIVCKHVMNGSAEKVQVRRDKVCMCLACAEDPTILETEEINILDEPMLMERLKRISQAFDNERDEKKASGACLLSHI